MIEIIYVLGYIFKNNFIIFKIKLFEREGLFFKLFIILKNILLIINKLLISG